MDKRSKGLNAAAIIAAPTALASFLLPIFLRVDLVASLGVLAANNVAFAALWVGIASGATALGVGGKRAIDYIKGRNAKAEADKLEKAAAEKAEEEANLWRVLPLKEEANPDVLEPMLRRIATRYPDASPLLEITLEQLDDIRQSLAKISAIFKRNAGLISTDARFASSEVLIEKVLEEICPGLVRIVYQAYEEDNSDTSVPDLIKVVNDVNRENQPRVDETRNLANNVVVASTEGNTESVLAQVKEASEKLTKKEEGWL